MNKKETKNKNKIKGNRKSKVYHLQCSWYICSEEAWWARRNRYLEFVKKIKVIFSNKSKIADAKWKIETFKQDKKYVANFMIKFKTLAMKADKNELHGIFLLTKNVQAEY